MRRIFYALIVGAVVVAVGWWLAALPGHLSASLAGYTLETSAPIAILALVVVVLAVHALLIALFVAVTVPVTNIFLMRAALFRARRMGEAVPANLSRTATEDAREP